MITESPTKPEIRKSILALRDAMTDAARQEASRKLIEYVEVLNIQPGQIVSGFLPIRSEIDLRPLMDLLAQSGVKLCLPVVIDRQTIAFREYVQDAPLVDTGFGTSGPDESATILAPDVMLIPLAAFDKAGHRIGYGAGHYDRAISRFHAVGRSPRLIGVAFDCQRVQSIPAEIHDVTIHTVLTQSGLYSLGQEV